MAGRVRAKPGRDRYFELRVYAGKDPVTGRYRTISRGFDGRAYRTPAAARRAAERALLDFVVEVEDSRLQATEGSVSHLLQQWLAHVELEREQTTVKGYRSIVKMIAGDELGRVQLRHLAAKDLEDFYHRLRLSNKAGQTVRNYHTVLHRGLAAAVRWGWIPFNPADQVEGRSSKSKAITVPTLDEIGRLADEAASSRNPMMAAVIQMAAATGARRGELCGLRWGDVDAAAGTLLIEQAVAHGTAGLVRKGTKTHAARRVDIGPGTVAVLEQRRATAEAVAGGRLPGSAFVFSAAPDSSEPVKPNSITQAFHRIVVRQHLTHLRFHDLRHHFATTLLARGVDVGTVADLLGHADASVTLKVYRHFVPAAGRQAAHLMDGILFPIGAER